MWLGEVCVAESKKGKKNTIISLENILWNCRVALRGIGSTEKNRDAVIALVFLKFAGDNFQKRREEIIKEQGDIPIFLENVAFYNAKNVFYLNDTARWSYIVDNASKSEIAVIIDKAMEDVEEQNDGLKGALPLNLFSTLAAEQSKIKSLIDNVNKIDEKQFQDKDLIGRVYEYFLRAYAAAGTKEDGEFYTPVCVVKLIAELIEPLSGIIYDPCCGSGGMFVQSMKFVESHNIDKNKISIVGQESNAETWRLCKMNLAGRGIAHDLGATAASTFTNDLHKDLKVDYIMANPPFNLKNWRDTDELTKDSRFAGFPAVPPVANANYAWILHIISKLNKEHGIAGFLLANGALNADDIEYSLRKEIILRDVVESIIVLPRDMFYTTDISVTLWILNINKKAGTVNGRKVRDRTGEILFVDLRRWDSQVEEIVIDKGKKKKKTILSDEQIFEVKKIYHDWQSADRQNYSDVPELCKATKLAEIQEKDYSLAPSKYVEFIDHDLEIDFPAEMQRIQSEMKRILAEEKAAQGKLIDAFKNIGYGIE